MLCYDVYCKIYAEIDSMNVAFEYFTKKCIDVAKMVCYDKCCKICAQIDYINVAFQCFIKQCIDFDIFFCSRFYLKQTF